MSAKYIPGEIDLEDSREFVNFLNHIAPHIRKIKVDEEQQAQWIWGTLRAFGYSRRQLHHHHYALAGYEASVHSRFMEDYFSANFSAPDSYRHKEAEDYACPDNWLPHIKAGNLHLYLAGLNAPVQVTPDASEEKTEETYKSRFETLRAISLFQSVVIIGLILTVLQLRG